MSPWRSPPPAPCALTACAAARRVPHSAVRHLSSPAQCPSHSDPLPLHSARSRLARRAAAQAAQAPRGAGWAQSSGAWSCRHGADPHALLAACVSHLARASHCLPPRLARLLWCLVPWRVTSRGRRCVGRGLWQCGQPPQSVAAAISSLGGAQTTPLTWRLLPLTATHPMVSLAWTRRLRRGR